MIATVDHHRMPQSYYEAFVAYYEAMLRYERERGAVIEEIECKRPWDYAMASFFFPAQYNHRVLDLACGKSCYILFLAQSALEVYGIDDASWIWTAEWIPTLSTISAVQGQKIRFIKQNAATLPYPDEFFDRIYTFSALEHFTNADEASCIAEVRRVLRSDGVFCGTVDYNPVTTNPKHGVTVYTRERFLDSIVSQGGFALIGEDELDGVPLPESVDYVAAGLFFALRKDLA